MCFHLGTGLSLGFIKQLSASGNDQSRGERRRSSTGAGALGHFAFSHLRILDIVVELLLREDARQLHEACAKCLQGVVDEVQQAMHCEQAGLRLLRIRTRIPTCYADRVETGPFFVP